MANMYDSMVVAEFRGDYPTITNFDDINVEELTLGDDDPMFVTLPIGKANVTSRHKNFYSDEFIRELERQVRSKKPIGIMGHLSSEDVRNMNFPPEAVHWIGVQRVGELLWGKGYVPPGEERERIRRYKAQNKRVATSIYGTMSRDWDQNKKAYVADPKSFDLYQIDLGPVDRAGIPALGAVPIVASEMVNTNEENNMTDRYDVIREMTADDVPLIPDAVVQDILDSNRPDEVGIVTELRTVIGDEDTDVVEFVRTLLDEREQVREQAVQATVQELVSDAENGIKAPSIRQVVVELVRARNPQTPEEAETAYREVIETDHVKELLEDFVKSAMGPKQASRVERTNGRRYFQIPKEDD